MKYEKPCDWYLSGIGRNDSVFGWDTFVPREPDYDARKEEGRPSEHDCDSAVAYTNVNKSSLLLVPTLVATPKYDFD